MNVWLMETGEPLPVDRAKGRAWRVGLLAEALRGRGHDVTWWASTFDHSHKRHRSHGDAEVDVKDRYRIILLHGPAYRKNVSLGRIINHRAVARRFRRLSRREVVPDLVFCCLPTIDLAAAATGYGRRHGVPVVLDLRDMWPDVMAEAFPRPLRPLAGLLLGPLHMSVRRSCRRAAAVSGITPAFVARGLKYAGRPAGPFDRDFPLAYPVAQPEEAAMARARAFWQDHGLTQPSPVPVFCFIGSLSPRLDLMTVIRAARRMESAGREALFVICGTGEDEARLKSEARGVKNVVFPGWIGYSEIWTLTRLAWAGLAPYPNTPDFMSSIPNKVIEYLAGGLPVVASVRGTLEALFAEHQCGITITRGDDSELARVLTEFCDHPERVEVMRRKASRLFEDRFRADKVYDEMARHLERIAGTGVIQGADGRLTWNP